MASAFSLCLALLGCPAPKTRTIPKTDTPPPTTDNRPSQVLATGAYEVVWPGLDYGSNDGRMRHVVAARDVRFEESLAVGSIDAIATSQSERADSQGNDLSVSPLYSKGDAVVASVAVSPGTPEKALFLVDPLSVAVLGSLYIADLSTWPAPTAKPLPGNAGPAVNVPVGGYFFGKAGNQILLVEQMPATGGAGILEWSDGANTPSRIGNDTFPQTVQISADRGSAAALVNVTWRAGSTGLGKGDLVAVNMTTGKFALVASGVAGMANYYAPTNCGQVPTQPECSLRSAFDRAYSMSSDGRRLAYAKDGSVFLAVVDYSTEVPTVTQKSISAGRFPGLSRSGERLAFYDDGGLLQVYDVSNTQSVAPITSTPSAGLLCPTFTPDDGVVMFLEKLTVKGNDPRFGSDIGTLRMKSLSSPQATPVTYADHVLWHSLTFWPDDPGKATAQFSVLGNVHDPLNPQVFTADRAVGDLLVDSPTGLPGNSRPRASTPVATSIVPSNFALLPASGGFGILTATGPTTTAIPNADVWLPASPVVRPGSTQHLAQFVVAGSLQTSASIPGLSGVDEVIVSVSNPSYTWLYDGRLLRGDLWGSAAGPASLLKADVFFQTLSTDGRVLAIHPETDSPDSRTTEIWSLPLQGSR